MRLIKFIFIIFLSIYFIYKINIDILNYNFKINIIIIINYLIDLLKNLIEVINQNEILNSIEDLNNDSIENENEESKVFYKNKIFFWFITGIVILSLLYVCKFFMYVHTYL